MTLRKGLGGVVGLAALVSCSDSMATLPLTPGKEVLQQLLITPHTITMAEGDTATLTATAVNVLGDTMTMDTPVTWAALDEEVVSVDSTGKIAAHRLTDNFVHIVGTWTHGGSTKVDTVFVNVTESRYPVAHFKLTPIDSTGVGAGNFFSDVGVPDTYLTVDAVDNNGKLLFSPRVNFEFHDTLGKPIFNGYGGIQLLDWGDRYLFLNWGSQANFGNFWVIAYSTMYGIPVRDSLQFTSLYPSSVVISINRDTITGVFYSSLNKQTTILQPCGVVAFESAAPVDILFDDPSQASGCVESDTAKGNIIGLSPSGRQFRKFPAAGTRTWSMRNPSTGKIELQGTLVFKRP